MILHKTLRGGGLKVLALLAVIGCMIATLIPANTVQAADEAYNLYYVDQHMQIEQMSGTQFTKVGRYYSGAPCAVTTDNKVWTQPTANDKPAVNPSITAASCADDPNKTNYYLPLHSNIWSAYLTASAPTVTYVGIDADGYLWMSDNDHNVGGSGSAVLGETPVRLGVQFFDPLKLRKPLP